MADKDGSTEMFMGWGIILIFIGIIAYFMYRIYTPEILNFLRWFRYGEMWIIAAITPDDFTVMLPNGKLINVQQWVDSIPKIPQERLDFKLYSVITAAALTAYKWPIIIFIAGIGLWAYKKGPGTQYTEKFNLNSFIRFQAKAFPIIAPFVEFNPCKMDPRAPGSPVPAELPVFAEALGPEEWIAYNQLPVPDGKIDEDALTAAFTRQLGKRWRGIKMLAPYKIIILAAFCLKASRKRNDSDDIMGRIARCWSHDKGLELSKDPTLITKAKKILNNKDLAYKVIKNCNQHAWETTAMLRGLLTAREEGGVLAPAQFVWLRGHDRNLWYALNGLGRQSCFTEALGASSHFRAEKRSERPIPKPKIQDAVDSMVEYMDSQNARPIPVLDYSKTQNKRGIKKLKKA